jgi:hypothetical protein
MKRFTFLALISLALSFLLLSYSIAQNKGNQVEYRLVKEIELGKGYELENLPLEKERSPEMSRIIRTEKWLALKRTVPGKLLFYDNNFNLLATRSYTSARVSKNSNYVVVYTVIQSSILKERPGIHRIELLDNRGQVLWTKTLKENSEEYGQPIYPSDKGVTVGPGSEITFLDTTGEQIAKCSVREELGWYAGGVIDFSADGEYVAINATNFDPDVGYDTENPRGQLFLFNTKGKELWRFLIDEYSPSSVAIAPKGEYIITCNSPYTILGKSVTRLFSKKGELIGRWNKFLTRKIHFSSSGGYALLEGVDYSRSVNGRDKVRLIETGTGRLLLDYQPPKRVFSMDIAEGGKLIGLVLDKRIFTGPSRSKKVCNPEALIMDFDEDKVWSKPFQDEFTEGQIHRYTLRLSDSGEDLTVRLGKRLMKFKIAE